MHITNFSQTTIGKSKDSRISIQIKPPIVKIEELLISDSAISQSLENSSRKTLIKQLSHPIDPCLQKGQVKQTELKLNGVFSNRKIIYVKQRRPPPNFFDPIKINFELPNTLSTFSTFDTKALQSPRSPQSKQSPRNIKSLQSFDRPQRIISRPSTGKGRQKPLTILDHYAKLNSPIERSPTQTSRFFQRVASKKGYRTKLQKDPKIIRTQFGHYVYVDPYQHTQRLQRRIKSSYKTRRIH